MEPDEKTCAWCHAHLARTPRYKRFGTFYCSLKCACVSDGFPLTMAGVAFLEAYAKAPSLTCKLFQAVADADFVPLTDAERADALQKGRDDREAADRHLVGVRTISGRRYR